jgi:two-component system, cell cycle sensor histidine kinase and response regulator CckA
MKGLKFQLIRYGKALGIFVLCLVLSAVLRRFSYADQGLLILAALGFAAWFGGTGPGVLVAILIELISWAGANRPPATVSALIFGGANRLAILVIIALLVSARRKADARIRSQSEWLQVTLSSIDDAVITTDLKGIVGYMNPTAEELTGWSASVATGMPIEEVFQLTDANIGSEELTDVNLISKDGTTRQIDVSVSPLRTGSEESKGSVFAFRDVTARKQLQDQFRQSQKMEAIGQLAGGVAHDFNNLLTVILGYCQLAKRKTKDNGPLSQDLDQIEEASARATTLVAQLLAFSRKQVLRLETLNLNEIVARSEKMLIRLIGEDVDLVTNTTTDIGHVRADAGQVEQIILNLVVNARDAMPNGGKLTIETANVELDENYAKTHLDVTPGQYVLLAISDTGHGMDAKTQARVFEPFFTTKELGKGTGLGLSTVFGIVKQSGGHIWLYSEPEKGTTFKIYLPRVDEPVNITEIEAAAVDSLRGSETLLLTEDDEAVRLLAEKILATQGYQVLVATSGAGAMEIIRQTPGISLLITDLVMPGLTGRELATELEKIQPDSKVLYLSGYAPSAIVHQGVLDEGVAFLAKPFTPDALARRVRQELDR